jgi:hypothetical protein
VVLLSAPLQKRKNGSNGRLSKKKLNVRDRKCRKRLSSGDRKHWLRPRN